MRNRYFQNRFIWYIKTFRITPGDLKLQIKRKLKIDFHPKAEKISMPYSSRLHTLKKLIKAGSSRASTAEGVADAGTSPSNSLHIYTEIFRTLLSEIVFIRVNEHHHNLYKQIFLL